MKILKNWNQKNTHSIRQGAMGRIGHIILIDAPANAFLDSNKPNIEMENL